MSGVRGIVGFRRIVGDLARTEAFYRDGLGFLREAPPAEMPLAEAEALGLSGPRPMALRMRVGSQSVTFIAGAPGPAPAATDPSFQHLAISVRDTAAAFSQLATVGASPISLGGPQVLPPSSGGVTAYKFRDPDGLPLELIEFPTGPSAARWAAAPGLFLGIDHSAATVTDLDGALAFFAGALGLVLSERGLNRGPEQARLDGLDDPVVDVIALKPAEPAPHVELLHYRRATESPPGPTRPAAARPGEVAATVGPVHRDDRPSGRSATSFVFAALDPAGLGDHLRQAGFPARSSADGRACHATGPEGHGCLFVRVD